jgi:urea transport system ATP-binding protein
MSAPQGIHPLAAEGVCKTFDGFKAISNLNFYMDEGELRTVIGPNGAGKTTFLDLITGRTKPDTGKIRVRGRWRRSHPQERIRNLPPRHWPQIPDPHRLHRPHRFREPPALPRGEPRRLRRPLFPRHPGPARPHPRGPHTIGLAAKGRGQGRLPRHGQKQWLEIGMLLAQNAASARR